MVTQRRSLVVGAKYPALLQQWDNGVGEGVEKSREVAAELRQFVNSELMQAVNRLIASSSSKVVADALAEALKSVVLVTRNANRNDDPKNVLVVRPALSISRS